jgi:hypothetical protein
MIEIENLTKQQELTPLSISFPQPRPMVRYIEQSYYTAIACQRFISMHTSLWRKWKGQQINLYNEQLQFLSLLLDTFMQDFEGHGRTNFKINPSCTETVCRAIRTFFTRWPLGFFQTHQTIRCGCPTHILMRKCHLLILCIFLRCWFSSKTVQLVADKCPSNYKLILNSSLCGRHLNRHWPELKVFTP